MGIFTNDSRENKMIVVFQWYFSILPLVEGPDPDSYFDRGHNFKVLNFAFLSIFKFTKKITNGTRSKYVSNGTFEREK